MGSKARRTAIAILVLCAVLTVVSSVVVVLRSEERGKHARMREFYTRENHRLIAELGSMPGTPAVRTTEIPLVYVEGDRHAAEDAPGHKIIGYATKVEYPIPQDVTLEAIEKFYVTQLSRTGWQPYSRIEREPVVALQVIGRRGRGRFTLTTNTERVGTDPTSFVVRVDARGYA